MVVEITYRGIRVGRAKLEGEGDPGFFPHEAPLPVGTRVMVYGDEGPPREAIVTSVVEQESTAKSPPGMKLRWAPAAAVAERVEGGATTVMQVPPVSDDDLEPEIEAVPEPADSSTQTMMMPAVTEADIEPADSPRVTLTNMPAIRDPEAPPDGESGGGKKKRRRR